MNTTVNKIHLSPYFMMREFECRGRGHVECGCGGAVMLDLLFYERLIIFRRKIDLPMKLTRGYSCAGWNAKIGGADYSKHMRGQAIDWDVYSSGYTEKEAAIVARDSKLFTGIGVYGRSYRDSVTEDIVPTRGYKNLRGMIHLEYCRKEDSRPEVLRGGLGDTELYRTWGDW